MMDGAVAVIAEPMRFFVTLLTSSDPRRTHVAYHISDAANGEFLLKDRPHRGRAHLAAEFPALARTFGDTFFRGRDACFLPPWDREELAP